MSSSSQAPIPTEGDRLRETVDQLRNHVSENQTKMMTLRREMNFIKSQTNSFR
ncbi:unnamed protein product, partial [Amoebophrya sp. A25]|eukprot:GSA25T00014126001.1